MRETGEHQGGADIAKRASRPASSMLSKRVSHFSPILSGSRGVTESLGRTETDLTTVRDNSENVPPPPDPHWSFKQQKKNLFDTAVVKAQSGGIHDSCPFHREDSAPDARAVHPATPHKRSVNCSPGASPVSPNSNNDPGREWTESGIFEAERTFESRRDFKFWQDKPGFEDVSPMSSVASAAAVGAGSLEASMRSVNLSPAIQRSQSQKTFSSPTLVGVNNPVHSVRPRPQQAPAAGGGTRDPARQPGTRPSKQVPHWK